MDPERYYKYSDLGTIDDPKGRVTAVGSAVLQNDDPVDTHHGAAVKPEEIAPVIESAAGDISEGVSLVYNLDILSERRPGPVLAVGFGNQLKSVVKAAVAADVHPLYTTGTDDKFRAFSFGNTATVISIGKKFNEKLFQNDYAVLDAISTCGAKTVLWAQSAAPSNLVRIQCERNDVLLLLPMPGDKTGNLWERAEIDEAARAKYAGRSAEVEWRKCHNCGLSHDNADSAENNWACPTCGKLYRLTTDERIAITFDEGSFEEWDTDVEETDPMGYPDYDAVLERAHKRSGYDEAVRCGKAKIHGIEVASAIMEPSFIMGSMGSVVGEKITRMIERATEMRLPAIIFSASGGARMQEGLASLMQMAKTSAAIEAHNREGLLYISVYTDPTTGGVTASFAMLGDIILSEPGAMIGFAGRRVIQDTIKQALPEDFQTAEFALEHGLIDAIVGRMQMRDTLAQILQMHSPDMVYSEFASDAAAVTSCGNVSGSEGKVSVGTRRINSDGGLEVIPGITEASAEKASASQQNDEGPAWIKNMPGRFKDILGGITSLADTVGKTVGEQASNASLRWAIRNQGVADAPYMKPATSPKRTGGKGSVEVSAESNHAWESVQLARNAHRPTASFYIAAMVDDFIELHGDRAFADDGAIIGGIGKINGQPVTIIAEEKGSNLKERIARNFGCPQPEGYRKVQRLMRQADKFGRPVVCFVDTQGAFCGKEAEERGMGNAIAESLALMAGLRVPVISVVIGEGGSGGALALAVANRVAMQENAVYSVLSPEGFASILWKDGSRAPEAAAVMRMSAVDAFDMGMVEDVIPEGNAPAHENPDQAAAAIWLYITNALADLCAVSPDDLRQQRYSRFRNF